MLLNEINYNINVDYKMKDLLKHDPIFKPQTLYWFRGIKMPLNVISDIILVSQADININALNNNQSIQQYIRTFNNINIKYKPIKKHRF